MATGSKKYLKVCCLSRTGGLGGCLGVGASFTRAGKGLHSAVRADGSLDQPPLGGEPHLDSWQPAAVCWCPVLKGQELLATLPPPAVP